MTGLRAWSAQARAVVDLCFRAAPWQSAALLGCELVANGLLLVSMYAVKPTVDAALRADFEGVVVGAVLIAGGGALSGIFFRGYLNLIVLVLERSGLYIDAHLMQLSAGIPTIEHHERPRYADEMSLLRQERQQLPHVMNAIVQGLRVALSVGGSVAVLARLDPVLALLPVLALPAVLAHRASNRLATAAREANAERLRLSQHLFEVAVSSAAGKEVRVFGLGAELARRHRELLEANVRQMERAAFKGVGLTATGSLVFAGGYAGAVGLVVQQAIAGHVTVGSVALAISLVTLVNLQLSSAAQTSAYLAQVVKAAGRLVWLQDHARSSGRRSGAPAVVPSRLSEGIELRDLCFTYPDTERPVLDHVDLRLPTDAVVALVGENGSGKTTLVKLLNGLYRPSAGSILVDGTDLARFEPEEWRRRVRGAFQDFGRFELLLQQSVGVGDLPRAQVAGAVEKALLRAGGEELGRIHPDGLSTQLGVAWGGVDLSGGQWQKVALGRGLMREEALLTVFDEPTASLDAETERGLLLRLADAAREGASRGCVTLLVSHRFNTVKMADLIVVLRAGRVVGLGDHAELMRSGGLYAELYELQSRGYR